MKFVRKAKRMGMSLAEIGDVLRLHDWRESTCVHVRTLLDEKLARVDRAIAELTEFRSEIADLRDRAGTLDDCRPGGGLICSIIENSDMISNRSPLDWMEPLPPAR